MTVSITHKFVSAKGNGADLTQVQPSNWNDTHTMTCAANSVLGNTTGSPAAVAEIPAGTLGVSILASNTLADLIAAGIPIFTTGDVKLTIKTAADTGWLMCNDQTIGNTSSGATFADASAQSLYTLLWNNVSNSFAPVTGGRGANAAADWAAQKKLQLTLMMGRALGIAGAGSGLTSRALGTNLGEENHTLSSGEMPSHSHPVNINDPGHSHNYTGENVTNSGGAGSSNDLVQPTTKTTSPSGTGITATTTATGGGGSHNNMQPTSFLNAMIKL